MKSIKYNTDLKKIIMKEYGRTIQQMVGHCLSIEDRGERLLCAEMIVQTMAKLTHENIYVPEVQAKLWNHVAIISNFELDIDYPVEIIRKEESCLRPDPMSIPKTNIKHRHYGYIIEEAIRCLEQMSEGQERDALTRQTADRMRQNLFTWNTDVSSEDKVIRDIHAYTNGNALTTALDGYKFAPLQNIPLSMNKKKNKKR